MALPRRMEAEWLDELPAEDPRAIRSRRDLRLINALMLQPGIMARSLLAQFPGNPRSIIDLGAGDGTFMLRVARRLAPSWPRVNVLLVDRHNVVSAATRSQFSALGYRAQPVVADVFEFLERAPAADIICANLFLHHFTQAELLRLLALAARSARLLVACEPRRAAWPLLASHLLWAVGCKDVSRHDAVASVRAGFDGRELSALWPERVHWRLDECPARLFTHYFAAWRGTGGAP
jgi:hypothetical protein